MQANWSLILNVLLLIGVVVAIGRLMKARRQNLNHTAYQPSLGQATEAKPFDDIIAVRKVSLDSSELPSLDVTLENPSRVQPVKASAPRLEPDEQVKIKEYRTSESASAKNDQGKSVMMFLLAKENRQLAGYELLQTVLAAGLRFGEGHLFHRHQQANGQGPVLCSLAAATATGVFDLQNIGAFSVRGLCLFMQTSGNSTIDAERFAIMYETAKQLSDGLDTYLLDDKRRPLNEDSLKRYYQLLNISFESEIFDLA